MIKRLLPVLTGIAFCASAAAESGYFREPDLHNNTLVFTAEGDLWLSQIGQPSATRLTTSKALEHQAAFSADGQQVAFVANYEGTNEVYVIPATGGVAKRVTFENSYVYVQGWTADGRILFSTNSRVGPSNNWTLKTVELDSLETQTIPLADAIEGDLAADSQTLYFTQFGLQVSRDNARYYRGGAQGELWRFSLNKDNEASLLTEDHDASAREPMVDGDKLYFISNKNGNDNLWVMNTNGKRAKALTDFQDYPIRHAKIDNGRIVFQHGADLKIYDTQSGRIQTLDITLTSDFPELRDKWLSKPTKYLTHVDFSGETKQVVLTARGRLAIANTDGKRLIEIDTPPATRSRKAILSKDGKWVYALNDASGEMEIWQFAADGSAYAKQLTFNANISRWRMVLSPDQKSIAYDDFNGDLWLLNIESGDSQKIYQGQSEMSPYADIVFSSDSQLLAITTQKLGDERSRIYLYNLAEQKGEVLTSDKYHSYSPSFSPDQKWLYFLSDREFTPTTRSPWGDRNMGTSFDKRTQIFAYALSSEAEFPFQQPNELMEKSKEPDETEPESTQDASDTAQTEESAEATEVAEQPTLIEWAGLNDRLWQVPVPASNYSDLVVSKKYLYVIDRITEPGSKPELKTIEISNKHKVSTFVSGVAGYKLSDDGEQLLILKQSSNNDQIFVVPAGSSFPSDANSHLADTRSWKLLLSPKDEWQQLFNDAWLMHRDFFFDKNMRGVDWPAVKQKYQPLMARITDRYELNDVLAQMIGELNVLHSQVYGGDVPEVADRPAPASLGANLTQTPQGVTIEHIYAYDTELPAKASPLNKPGTDAESGDVIVNVNQRPVSNLAELNHALINQAGKQVILGLQRNGEAHQTVVYPVSYREDAKLRYLDWTTRNREKVTTANSDIGYLHLYAMGSNDVSDFAREFYANYQKDGLIIDVRRNRGGNIDSWIIEKLLRKVWMFWTSGNAEPNGNMQQTFRGHLVVLADQYTYSDGETFTAAVKALELGPVIGKQTAGAGIWLRGLNRLADNGMARVAELPVFALDGRWITEGHGITPDIEVDNLPHETYEGKDAQLEAAIKYLQKQLKKHPVKPLKAKPYPALEKPADDVLR